MYVVRPRFGNTVDTSAGSAAKFRAGAAGHNLKFLYGVQRDIDRSALAAHLLAKEAVVVVSAIQADVVEDASLAVEIDLVAVGSLDDAHAGCERQQVFKFASQYGSGAYRELVQRARRRRLRGFNHGCGRYYDPLRSRRNLHGDRQRDCLSY